MSSPVRRRRPPTSGTTRWTSARPTSRRSSARSGPRRSPTTPPGPTSAGPSLTPWGRRDQRPRHAEGAGARRPLRGGPGDLRLHGGGAVRGAPDPPGGGGPPRPPDLPLRPPQAPGRAVRGLLPARAGDADRHPPLRERLRARPGPRNEAGVVAIFTEALLEGRRPEIFGDGEQVRDFVYVEDVVAANLLVLGGGLEVPVHIATGRGTSVNALLRLLAEAVGVRPEAGHGPAVPGEVRRIVLDVSRAERLLGWRPRVSLEEGLR